MNEKLREKAIRVQPFIDFSPLMTKYGIYDQSDLREFMSKVSINTPKHETVEELREAYEWIVEENTNEIQGEESGVTCLECGEDIYIYQGNHEEDCIVGKADKWLSNHGKPEIEG